MAKYIINGGAPLYGSVAVQGAKNAVLPLFAGAILTDEPVIINNCPKLLDVENMSRILKSLGADVERRGDVAKITADSLNSHEIPWRLARELRSSIFLLGSLLARTKKAKVAYPGGCDIGLRPIDIHLKALRELGVKITEKHGYIYCDGGNLRPSHVTLDYPSVGATENVILLATAIDGVTVIDNAAREPEIEDLGNYLNAMGASVTGAGDSKVIIEGARPLHGCSYATVADRIVAGTYLMATAICGGKIELTGVNAEHLRALLAKLSLSGCKIVVKGDIIVLESDSRPLSMGKVDTQPYPGFPTDLQAPLCALASVAEGNTMIVENIFEMRFKHIPELRKMNADIHVKDRVANINGIKRLVGAEITAMDLRGGAALVLAGLNAHGTTIVNDIHHIERGYQDFDETLSLLGADITKV